MSRAIAALAARYVGRRVQLTPGTYQGTVTRVTGQGLSVTITGLTAGEVATWLD